MKVHALIAELTKLPPEAEVRIWDEQEDEYLPIAQAIHEDGAEGVVDLLTKAVKLIPNRSGDATGGVK